MALSYYARYTNGFRPRVVRDTTGQELPEGFQTSEFLLEHGFLDFITHRRDLKNQVNKYIDLISNQPLRA